MNGILGTVRVDDDPFTQLSAILSRDAHEFLQPSVEIQQIAIRAAKAALDPVATSVIDAQIERRKVNSRKRKRGEEHGRDEILQLRQIHTAGFEPKQVWEQARRVLDVACNEIERIVESHTLQRDLPVRNGIQYSEVGLGSDESGSDHDLVDGQIATDEESSNHEFQENEVISDEEDIEEDSDIQQSSDDEATARMETYIQDPNGLNDGFFSIDDFNKQTQFLEQMDGRGDDDNPSDEDEVDWDADPLAMTLGNLKSKAGSRSEYEEPADDYNDDEDEDEEDGPSFGDSNLDELDHEDDFEMDGDQDLDTGLTLSNANEIKYADFFEPPPKKLSKTKRMRALPKTQPQAEDVTNDVERAMADVRRDLLDSEDEDDFDDDEDDNDAEQDDSDTAALPRAKRIDKNMSTHEKQRATIAAEIRRLEAANVAKRDWQLSGEARAADRPINSLLEEDLEFERAGKPVPVVTAETSEEIEQLIKRRILAREFDEVIRRNAIGVGTANETRRGRIELDDGKPQASLGELYEQDHLKATDPGSYVDKRSAATKKQHEQIDILWREVNEQLNLLSNLHFKPKRVDIEVKTVEDKPRIMMEDARPVGDIESGEGGMLAPQEVYRPGSDGNKDAHIIAAGKSGTSMNREELTREEKLRRRRREKERTKKTQANRAQIVLGNGNKNTNNRLNPKKSKEQDKNDIFNDLKKGNVKVIGKDGAVHGLGKQKKSEQAIVSSGNLKM